MQAGTIALAVDIGGTKVDAALVDADGAVLPGTQHRAPTGRDAARDDIAEAIRAVAAAALHDIRPGDRLSGIGVGSAGPVDLAHGTIAPLNLPAIADLRVVALLEELSPGIPVRLALDGACIALAEHWRGAAAGARGALAMVVSTGIGGGLIVNGAPVTGLSGNAGHIGQLRLLPRQPGRAATDGTLESIASGPATVAWARAQGWRGSTGEELAAGYAAGDPIATAAVRRSAAAVGQAIADVTTLLDLEVAVVAGGFARVAEDYIDLVRSAVRDAAVFDYARRVRVEATGLDGNGPLVGAAALVLR
ncbi:MULTISPECIES: ROK family protein [unclassified Microbacterium]|uniref:ROK family protein n=1 Tax=unclassified Microbacterium TaxID=2609290 RepID=UPI00214C38BA|nr:MULTISPECIES: ROK family protein [unclassified Microbacterium]MCR2810878.1 ROK family protein [Microbacterium sp. zg.B185]WIM19719.1 ROK family protein [Microbacterium sp. zg-B185]